MKSLFVKTAVVLSFLSVLLLGNVQSFALPMSFMYKPEGADTENYEAFRTQLDVKIDSATDLNDMRVIIEMIEANDFDASLNKDRLFKQLKDNVVGWLAEGAPAN